MAHGDGKSDGERSRSADARSVGVARGEHGQHEHEGDEQLDAEHHSERHSSVRLRRTHHVRAVVRRQALKERSADDCTDCLNHDVQERTAVTTNPRTHTLHSSIGL